MSIVCGRISNNYRCRTWSLCNYTNLILSRTSQVNNPICALIWSMLYACGQRFVVADTCVSYTHKCARQIDLSQPGHETAFWLRQNGPVASQLTNPIKGAGYPLELIRIYVHINTQNKKSLTHKAVVDQQMSNCVWLFDIFIYIFKWCES